mmetsp:Transcript_25745/g.59534  ORF Transcript_25745/g.59534 Transcript_25745/m.59534 type:complete len:634 (+) Transcript_25745:94-1995(+)
MPEHHHSHRHHHHHKSHGQDGLKRKHHHRRHHAHGELVQLSAGARRGHHPAAFVDHAWFNLLLGCVVMANAVTIGLEIDYGKQNESLYTTINSVFLLVYIIELCLRLLVHGVWIFTDPMIVFDFALVVTAVIERALEGGLDNPAMPTFRLMRLFRLAKTWKVLKERADVSVMLRMLKKVTVIVAWVVVILFFMLLSCASFAYKSIGQSAEWNDLMSSEAETFDRFDNFEYFGSIERSFFTLFQVITLSQWASKIARPVLNVYPSVSIFFAALFFVTSYGLFLCILGGVVQDSLAQSRDSQRAKEEISDEERGEIGQRALKMLAMVDANGSGKLDESELHAALQAPNSGLKELLEELGVPVLDAASLIAMMDTNGDKRVNYSEIVEGALRMGDPIDNRHYILVSLRLENLTVRTKALEGRLEKLTSSIAVIRSTCAEGFAAVEHTVSTADATKLRQRALNKIRTSKPPAAPASTARSKSKFLARLANAGPSPLLKERTQPERIVALMEAADTSVEGEQVDLPPPPLIAPVVASWPQWDGQVPARLLANKVAWGSTIDPVKKETSQQKKRETGPAPAPVFEQPRVDLLPAPPPGIRTLVRQAVAAKLSKTDIDDPYKLQDFQSSPAFARVKGALR